MRKESVGFVASLAAVVGLIAVPGFGEASVTAPEPSEISSRTDASDEAVEVAQLGGRRGGRESSAFKPDGIYGGGRGRDPYGAPLEADPYRGGGNPNNIKFAPPNAGLHGNANARPKKDDRQKAEEEAAPRRNRRLSPEDNRANRDAQRASEEAE